LKSHENNTRIFLALCPSIIINIFVLIFFGKKLKAIKAPK